MLENHSFDNMLGFSGIQGIQGLNGTESNSYAHNPPYLVNKPAPDQMVADPGHEFKDTLQQLCGMNAEYEPYGEYPPIDNSGFVFNFATSNSEDQGSAPHPNADHYGDVMKCFDTQSQLPVMYQLATEFAVCDNWFSSMPGPTWPNRFFAYAATSGSLDDSPSKMEIASWEGPDGGMEFQNGSILDLLKRTGHSFRLYQDNLGHLSFPIVLGLKGVHYSDMNDLSNLADDLKNGYTYPLTIIEPNYGNFGNNTYKGGSSQHPMDGVQAGETLIKKVYEAIRNSPVWETSLLIITYDEHGGFYDSVAPPPAPRPDKVNGGPYNTNGFNFTQYGVRVPAIVVSPYIPKNTVCPTLFDHTSMLKTVEENLQLPSLTLRDAAANSLLPILSSDVARTDCPVSLNEPAPAAMAMAMAVPLPEAERATSNLTLLPEKGNVHGFLAIANKVDHELSDGTMAPRSLLLAQVHTNITTVGQANDYFKAVLAKIQAQ